jgi:RNA recognition motif-containing protein
MHIYVGNLPSDFTDEELRKLFEPHGTVKAARIARDKKTDALQGYGFVEMPVKSEGRSAIEQLRGKEIKGQAIRVKALKPGDEFHSLALDIHGAGMRGKMPPPKLYRGDVSFRASGAIRRGGKRGA